RNAERPYADSRGRPPGSAVDVPLPHPRRSAGRVGHSAAGAGNQAGRNGNSGSQSALTAPGRLPPRRRRVEAGQEASWRIGQAGIMSIEPPVLETRDLTVSFGGHVAVNKVSCAFQRGTLTSIVGPNGAGKTTYFNLISGQLPATAGSVILNGQD